MHKGIVYVFFLKKALYRKTEGDAKRILIVDDHDDLAGLEEFSASGYLKKLRKRDEAVELTK